MIVAEQATEAFTPYHVTRLTSNASLRCEEPVGEPLMMALGMSVGEVWKCVTIPAACHVLPLVSSPLSTRTTSVQPFSAR